ncbi:hypothetical protein ASZ90_017351 [hydrocarbon metagenome]|uniref:PD-(D/E)XK endonuclease-like domain-containing protein n=1 Tax=hydrocarbon metagenome TaxID=938273 RepID=A0A0W8E9P9_9ZZZZ
MDNMNEFYILNEPEGNPNIPKYWSHSQLEEMRTCPKKWWLLRAKYPNIKGEYPRYFTLHMLHGIILHKTLENFGRYAKKQANYELARSSFRIRSTIQAEIRELLEYESSVNPRFKKSYLKSLLCIDDCINNFKQIISQVENVFISNVNYQYNASPTPTAKLPIKGHEVTIYVECPPIVGRIDFLNDGRIIDFKSGAPDSAYESQLQFYGLLYWLKTGHLPSSLEIVFSNHAHATYNNLLSIEKLTSLRDEVEEEIINIEESIQLGLPEANIRGDQCEYCPCRQNCDEYWIYLNKESQVIELNKDKLEPFWIDTEIIGLPNSWQGFGSCNGIGQSQQLGEVYLNIEPDKCPDRLDNSCPVGARILGAKLRYETNRWYLKTALFTEVFWIY